MRGAVFALKPTSVARHWPLRDGPEKGRVVLAHMAVNPESELALSVNRLLARELTRASERVLFPDLPYPARADSG